MAGNREFKLNNVGKQLSLSIYNHYWPIKTGDPKMKSYRKELWFEVPTRRAFINITPQVEECLRESGIKEGLVLDNYSWVASSPCSTKYILKCNFKAFNRYTIFCGLLFWEIANLSWSNTQRFPKQIQSFKRDPSKIGKARAVWFHNNPWIKILPSIFSLLYYYRNPVKGVLISVVCT